MELIPWASRDTAKAMTTESFYGGVNLKKGTSNGYFQDLTCDIEYTCRSGRLHNVKQTLPSRELAPLFSDVWTGSCVWECALLTSRLIEEYLKDRFENKHVLELGAGCGLSAVVACSETQVSSYVATDRGGMVDLARENADRNLKKGSETERFSCHDLSWDENLKEFSTLVGRDKFDIIVASDVINPIYGCESWPALARTMAHFSVPSETLIVLAYEQRETEGPIEEDELLNYFWGECKECGLRLEKTLLREGDCRFVFLLRKD